MEEKIPLKKEDIKFIVLHHSATPRELTTVEAIRRYHIGNRGFWDIGYHWIIDKDGNLVKGRSEEYIGAHAAGGNPANNFNSIGLAVVGNFENEKPTEEQLQTLFNFLKDKIEEFGLKKDKVLAHLEVKPTLCPGRYLFAKLIEWRKEKPEKNKIKEKIRDGLGIIIEVAKKLQEDIKDL